MASKQPPWLNCPLLHFDAHLSSSCFVTAGENVRHAVLRTCYEIWGPDTIGIITIVAPTLDNGRLARSWLPLFYSIQTLNLRLVLMGIPKTDVPERNLLLLLLIPYESIRRDNYNQPNKNNPNPKYSISFPFL